MRHIRRTSCGAAAIAANWAGGARRWDKRQPAEVLAQLLALWHIVELLVYQPAQKVHCARSVAEHDVSLWEQSRLGGEKRLPGPVRRRWK